MHSGLDLIPADYRARRQIQGLLKRAVIGYVVLGLLMGAARYGLHLRQQSVDEALAVAQLAEDQSLRQQQQIDMLTRRLNETSDRYAVHNRLLEGVPARQTFLVVDRSFQSDAWLERWHFERDADVDDATMTLAGAAEGYAALSVLVERLTRHPGVKRVRVNQAERNTVSGRHVDFEIELALAAAGKSGT